MSVDTKAYLKGQISEKVIAKILKEKLNATCITPKIETKIYKWENIQPFEHHHFGKDKDYITRSGFIDFKMPNNDMRMLWYFYTNCWASYEDNIYIEEGLEKLINTDRTHLSLGYWHNSVEIMKAITEEFGGWVDENDCDDKSYYYVRKRNKRG